MLAWAVVRFLVIFALVIQAGSAHHPSSANYDTAKFATLTGKIAGVQWTNPHVVLALDVARSDGTTERWFIEGHPPNTLRRNGWDRDLLAEGAEITVSGWQPRDGTLKIFLGREVTFEDGSKRLFGSGPGGWRCADGSENCAAAKWIPSIP